MTSNAPESPAPAAQPALRLRTRLLLTVISLVVAAAIWLPSVHLFFRPPASAISRDSGIPPLARKIAERHLHLWRAPRLLEQELDKMRRANAEWDFMGRSFFVWSLANVALREPNLEPAALEVMDRIIDATLKLERENGLYFFLMPYAKLRPFVQEPARSQFIDGEIALMLAMRCLVQDKPEYREMLSRRVDIIVSRMQSSPTLSAESYPDECWTFCNSVALAAIRLSDYIEGTDHSDLIRAWLDMAKSKLTDPKSGLLVSAYTLDGTTIYGPEGSSVWLVVHCLALLDEPFARQQYELAKKHLARNVLGFSFGREWPEAQQGLMDIDSGLVVPGLGASAASSGLAFVAAGTFGDADFTRALVTTLQFIGFPIERDGRLEYAASNQVGDAVLLYGLVNGPVWEKVKAGKR
ncbi:MAG: hypothetical protein QGD94_06275 [Planctomycetia bacterium]|nr:hypothetical protein [Planctomycetia bacterium]